MSALLNVTGQTGATTGPWFQTPQDGRTHLPMQVTISSGTANVVIEGRVDLEDQPVVIHELDSTDGFVGARFPHIRARLTESSNATVRVSCDSIMRQL